MVDLDLVRTDDNTRIQSQRHILEYLVSPETIDPAELLESMVSELGRHPEYARIIRLVSSEMYGDMVGAREVITVARRHPSDVATWLPDVACEFSYPWPPMLVEWIEFWYRIAEDQPGAIVPAVILDVIERGGGLENAVEAMIDEAIKGENIKGAAPISVNGSETMVYLYADQFVWRVRGEFKFVGVQKMKEGGRVVDVDGERFEFGEEIEYMWI
jgi:hypothetical protein